MLLKKHVCSRTLLMFLTGLGAQALHADSYMSNFTDVPGSRPHVVIQAGGFIINKAQSQHININGLIGDHFSADSSSDGNGLLGLGLFFNGAEGERVNFTYGINAFYLGKTYVSGTVTAEAQPAPVWRYKHTQTSYPIYFDAKLDIGNKNNERYGFTMDFGLGPNIMVTGNVIQQSLDNGFTNSERNFLGQTNIVFSGMAGVGFRISEVFGQAPLECGYRFFYLGKGDFSKTTNQLLTQFKTGTTYANALLCSVTI
ncbi:MAG: hypothetical protein P4L65_09605 [Legionella sp.]|nr:hypothetical protein [Legionella sp.]